MEGTNQKGDIKKRRPFSSRIAKSALNVGVLLFVYFIGVNVGNGAIGLTRPTADNKTLPSALNLNEVNDVYKLLRSHYDGELDSQKLIDGAKAGMVKATGDPYTEYMTAKEAKEFNEQLSGTFSGIGAQLGKDDHDNVVIVAPISGYPAEKAGLRSKDVITSIDGKNAIGISIDEAVSKIRGKKDTEVKLEIAREGSDKKTYTITREDIKIPSVEHEILPDNIGYIEITQFWDDTAQLVLEAQQEFQRAGVKQVVLDLRSNPGGSLDAAVDVADMWVPNGKTILQEKRDNKVIQTYNSSGKTAFDGIKTVVLIDEGSASASEILAGALKDNGVAQIVGVKSYGKGSVQQIIPLGNMNGAAGGKNFVQEITRSSSGGELKVTVARWFRPNGDNIDKKGIKPDVEVKMTEEDYKNGKDPQKDEALRLVAQ